MTALGDSVLLEGKLQLVLRESLLNLWNQISGDCGLWLKITELQIKNDLEVCSPSESEPGDGWLWSLPSILFLCLPCGAFCPQAVP